MSDSRSVQLATVLALRQRDIATRLHGHVDSADPLRFGSIIRWIVDSSVLLNSMLHRDLMTTRQLCSAAECICQRHATRPWLLDLDKSCFEKAAELMCRETGELQSQTVFSNASIHDLQTAFESISWQRLTVENGQPTWQAFDRQRKLAGAVYTPRYVVDYIVKHTIGPHAVGHDRVGSNTIGPPAHADGRTMSDRSGFAEGVKTSCKVAFPRVLDPACGTARFLLAAFESLLNAMNATTAVGKPFELVDPVAARRALEVSVFGVDTDAWAISISETLLKLRLLELHSQPMSTTKLEAFLAPLTNLACENVLTLGDAQATDSSSAHFLCNQSFDVVFGNPPYRRERNSKGQMDEIAATDFGREYRTARMDLWYYFVHRAAELLRADGLLSFIVNSYWTAGKGAEKLIRAFQRELHLEEIFDLDSLPVFARVSGHHMIVRACKSRETRLTRIRRPQSNHSASAKDYLTGTVAAVEFTRSAALMFANGRVDLLPATQIARRYDCCTPLGDLGLIRQGIAENPAAINRRTNERFGERWQVGDGVFVVSSAERDSMRLNAAERLLLRPYHLLKDLGRYYIATKGDHYLVYSTKTSCPEIACHPALHRHLAKYRSVMESRRETRNGQNKWWHLHWPRDESLWKTPKIVCVQMAERPSFVVARGEAYVSFSANVFVPGNIDEDLDYVAAVLNSRVLREWFEQHAKRRGVGLDISGRVLAKAPVRRIDFSKHRDVELHTSITKNAALIARLTARTMRQTAANDDFLAQQREIDVLDAQIDEAVAMLYQDSTAIKTKPLVATDPEDPCA